MEELRLLLDFSNVPLDPRQRIALRDELIALLRSFATGHNVTVLAPDLPAAFNCPANNAALTSGWKSKRWPVEELDDSNG